MRNIRVSLVGAGPGNPDLITLKGVKALQSADVVLYDALVNPDLLDYAGTGIPRIFVGKRAGNHYMKQDDINALIVKYALQYGHVVRLKGGDPFVFGRGLEEQKFIEQAGIPVTVIPGLSSATAAPVSIGMPLTHRGLTESFWVLTATTKFHEISKDIQLAAASGATMVILMGTRKLREVIRLIAEWKSVDTPVALVQNATLVNEKVIIGSLATIVSQAEHAQFSSPGIIIVGETVQLSTQFATCSHLFNDLVEQVNV